MIKLTSKLVKAYEYDRKACTLYLLFTNGRLYAYSGIDWEEYVLFLDSESKGAHFNLYIRNKKPFIEVMDSPYQTYRRKVG